MPSPRLHPFDVVLALRFLEPAGTFAELAEELSVSPSQVHASLRRLELAGLVRPGTREANRHALSEFVEFGVRYAFPAKPGSETVGVPTAHAADRMREHFDSADPFVWPAPNAKGAIRGFAVTPLYSGAPQLRTKSPATYHLLTLVDALRVGRARERNLAAKYIREEVGGATRS